MKQAPVVSIIMPAFNAEQYIVESINSIIKQSYQDWELIIVNDGSKDKTGEIVKEFAKKDSRIRLLENTENKGLVYTRNRGLREAKGKYLANLDSDDIAFTNRLTAQVEFLENNPTYVLVGSGCELINAEGIKIGEEKREIANHKLDSLLVFSNYFINSSVLFSKKAIEGLFYKEGTDSAEDYQFFTQLSLVGDVGNIDEPLIQYRVHNNNVSTTQAIGQRTKAKNIQYNQLKRLQIEISNEELDLHNQLVDSTVELKKEQLQKVEKWLLKLRGANREKKIYDLTSFDYWCSFFYQRSCLKVKAGIKSYLLFNKSELSQDYQEGIKSNLSFFVKSILKKP